MICGGESCRGPAGGEPAAQMVGLRRCGGGGGEKNLWLEIILSAAVTAAPIAFVS